MLSIDRVWCSPAHSYHSNGSIKVEIAFTTDESVSTILNKFYSAVAVRSLDEYEEYEDSLLSRELFNEDGSFKCDDSYNPYEAGILKITNCLGADKLHKTNNTYKYIEYVSNCYITRATLVELAILKGKLDDGSSDEGFRSGCILGDLLGAIETLDRFWD